MGWFESSQRNSSKRKGRLALAAWQVMAAGLCSSAVLMGCGSDKPQAGEEKPVAIESGNLKLALTGVSPSGAVYRLRNAEFRISAYNGSYETTVSTEDDPEGTFIYLEVPSGEYSVYLLPGYTVEQLNGGSGGGGVTPTPTGTAVTPTPPVPTTPPPDTTTQAVEEDRGFARAGEWPSLHGAAPSGRAARDVNVDGGAPIEEVTDVDVGIDGGSPVPDDGTGDELSIELISENPAYVYVYAYGLSMVNFSFLVNGGVVNTGSGGLIIGASFYEDDPYSYTCPGDDPYEPNDFYSPAYIPTDETIYAFSCVYEDDMYIFDAPVPEGQLFKISVSFDPSVADINIEYGTSYYEYLGSSFGVDGTESVVGVSNGGSYLLHVFNYGPESAPYQIDFDTDFSAANSCCETSAEPGCSDGAVLACLCAIDSACCTGAYDEVCAQEAIAECGAQCEQPEPTSTCCEAAPEPGCLDEDVEACVCDVDPTCCTSTFDQNCANLAQGQCGASCGGGE
jgi:hypothetical protein